MALEGGIYRIGLVDEWVLPDVCGILIPTRVQD
jgi:hypothetical protein